MRKLILAAMIVATAAMARAQVVNPPFGNCTTQPVIAGGNRGTTVTNPCSGGQQSFTYYVSQSSGIDTNPGTISQPFQTVAKVNSLALTAGQSVGFKSGDIWRETLSPTSSGSSGSPITFGAYGSGSQPKITGASLINSGWAQCNPCEAQQDAYTNLGTPANLNIDFNSAATKGAGQFTAGSSYSLNQVSLQLAKVGSPTGTITVSIYSDNGSNQPNADLGDAGTISTASLTTAYVTYTLTWSTPIALTSGTKYWIVVSPSGSVSGSNYVNVRLDNGGATGHFASRWNGTAWTSTASQGIYFVAFSPQTISNVWQYSALSATTLYVMFNGVQGIVEDSAAAITAAGEWYSAGNYLYVYSTSNPATAYTSPGVEASQLNNSVTSTASYLTFNGLDMSMGNSFANVIFGNNSGSNITVENCTIHDSSQTGLYFYGTQNGLAQNNTITNIYNGGVHSGSGQGNGVTVFGSNALANRITGNTISTSYRGVFLYGASGSQNPLGTVVDHNVIVTPYINGIDQFQVNAASNPSKVYNNTVIFSPDSSAGGQAGHGIDIQDAGADGWTAENNLVYATYTGTPTNVETVNISSTVALTTIAVDYNDYFVVPGGSSYIAQDNSGTKYSSLSTWQTFLNGTTYSGKDAHSISSDPMFVNFAGGNYALQPGSPAINTGTCISGITPCPTNIGAK